MLTHPPYTQLIHRYDITIRDTSRVWDMKPGNGLYLQDNMFVVMRLRETDCS